MDYMAIYRLSEVFLTSDSRCNFDLVLCALVLI